MNKNITTTRISQALAAVADIADCVARGDMALAGSARKTLDELCWSADGYPAPVRAALEAAGLRGTVG